MAIDTTGIRDYSRRLVDSIGLNEGSKGVPR